RSAYFFQAEDGIRDRNVTGVQTCALPIFIELFTDRRYGLFVDNYKSWAGTIHTSFYDKNNLIAGIRLGENTTLNKFDFKSWLQGGQAGLKEIKGTLDTDLKFTNADWQKAKNL